ncbi:MAG TPA: helix-turn-helix domain-containing protein [Candidatus Brocadiia bacterium]|nr:helix-turn-helix domain-containing protein [Candidatus Brocadiia bacterium]
MHRPFLVKPTLVRRISLCAHQRKPRGDVVRAHKHLRYAHEIVYVDYGAADVTAGPATLRINAGQLVIIHGGAVHSFRGVDGMPYSYLNVMFRGRAPEALFGAPITLDNYSVDLLQRLRQEIEWDRPYRRDAMASCLTSLLVHLARQALAGAPAPRQPHEPAYRRRYHSIVVSRALRIIGDSYATPLTLRQASAAAGVSASYLTALLKRETGDSFVRLLRAQRVEAAKRLLQESALTVPDIAEAVGYRSLSFFFKVFKRATGMTPAEYSRSLGDPSQRQPGAIPPPKAQRRPAAPR